MVVKQLGSSMFLGGRDVPPSLWRYLHRGISIEAPTTCQECAASHELVEFRDAVSFSRSDLGPSSTSVLKEGHRSRFWPITKQRSSFLVQRPTRLTGNLRVQAPESQRPGSQRPESQRPVGDQCFPHDIRITVQIRVRVLVE